MYICIYILSFSEDKKKRKNRPPADTYNPNKCGERDPSPTPRIVGGYESRRSSWPWQVCMPQFINQFSQLCIVQKRGIVCSMYQAVGWFIITILSIYMLQAFRVLPKLSSHFMK